MSAAPRGLAGPAVVMFAGTAASRVLGLVRNAVLALVLTVNVAGAANAFSVANKLPNVIFMLVAGGVLNAVLVPQIVRAMRQEDGGQEYVDRLLTMAAAALAALTIVLTAGATFLVALYGQRLAEWYPVAVAFAFWCIPQLFFYGLYTLLGQVLNARSSFGPYMWAPVLNNVVAIAGLGVFIAVYGTWATNDGADPAAWTPGRIALLAGTATAGVVAQALVLLIPLYRSGFRWSPRWGWRGTGLGRASRVAVWAFAGLAVGQLGYVVVSNVAAAAGTAGEGSPLVAGNAAYDNAFLVFMLPQSLITVSLVTALFTRMSTHAAGGELDKVRADMSFGLRTVGVFTVFATAALAVLALPVVRVVLPTVTFDEARSVAAVTLAMLLGLSALGAWTLLQRVYYSFEDTRTLFFVQIPMALIVAGGSLAAALLLEPRWWVPGAGLAMSLSTWTGALLAYRRLRPRLDTLDAARVLRTHVRLVLAAVGAALPGWGLLNLMGARGAADRAGTAVVVAGALVRVAVVGVVMVVLYVALLRLLRVDELDVLARPLGRVLRAVTGRVRSMTGWTHAAGAAPVVDGGGAVSGTATRDDVVEESTVLAGRFRLVEPIATDLPNASAWIGHDQVLDRRVQALLLRGRRMPEALDGARRAALVDDRRLTRVLSVGVHEGEGFVVTEVVDAPDLAGIVAEGPLSPERARAVVGEIASALEVAGRRGVHHLALRPSAVHVGATGQIFVTGLGLDAAQRGEDVAEFWPASRADAVGLVSLLYYVLTGSWPTPGADGVIIPPADLRPDLPNDLDTLCAVTLGPNDDGPHSPAEVVRELAPWHGAAGDPGEDGPSSRGGSVAVRVEVDEESVGDQPETPHPWTPREAPPPDDDARPPFAQLLAAANRTVARRSNVLTAPVRAPRHARQAARSSGPGTEEPTAPPRASLLERAGTSASAVATFLRGFLAAVARALAATGTAAGSVGRRLAHDTGRTVRTTADRTGQGVSRAASATGAGVTRAAGVTGQMIGSAAAAAGTALGGAAATVRRAYQPPPAPDVEQAHGARFDPTPYVLALMLALVLFGSIWAVGVLTRDSDERDQAGRQTVVEEGPTPAGDADAAA